MSGPRLVDVIAGLGQQINSIDGLRVTDHVPDVSELPAAFIVPPAIDYQQAYRLGVPRLELEVVVLVSAVVDRMQKDLFGYLDWAGPQSVAVAIRNDKTLGLTGVDANPVDCRQLSEEEMAGYRAYGCAVRVVITVTNS